MIVHTIDDLYKPYGKMLVQREVLDGQINQIRTELAKELNKPKVENGNNEVKTG